MSRYWSPIVHKLTPYVPGEQPKSTNLIKLNTNENPYGPSPRVVTAIQAAVSDTLRLYPDPSASALRETVARYHGLSADQIFVGNGSDEVLALVFQALLHHEAPLLFPDITYSFYPVYCKLYGITSETVPLTEAMTIDVDSYANRPCGGIIFANPNAPTGIPLTLEEIRNFLDQHPDQVVVIDEAYVDFGAETAISLISDYPNLLVVQTLSKSRSLAGLRVGLAFGQAHLIEGLNRVKDSFNSYPIDRLALVGAIAAYEDEAYFQQTCQAVMSSRQWLAAQLQELGFTVLPSATNFLFVTHPAHDAAALAGELRTRNIIVRHFSAPRIAQYLRISIGTQDECAAVATALTVILNPA
jgi:histidinol-phosphate aminotransferase